MEERKDEKERIKKEGKTRRRKEPGIGKRPSL